MTTIDENENDNIETLSGAILELIKDSPRPTREVRTLLSAEDKEFAKALRRGLERRKFHITDDFKLEKL